MVSDVIKVSCPENLKVSVLFAFERKLFNA